MLSLGDAFWPGILPGPRARGIKENISLNFLIISSNCLAAGCATVNSHAGSHDRDWLPLSRHSQALASAALQALIYQKLLNAEKTVGFYEATP
jgi:hypothetical protein